MKFVLICSVYALGIEGPEFPIGPLSLVTLTMFSKCPIAWEMNPDGAPAAISLAFPTTKGRAPRRGTIGIGRMGPHGTSFQSVLGYSVVKHPFFGAGFLCIDTA